MALALPCGYTFRRSSTGGHSGTARQDRGRQKRAECALAVAVSAAALDLIRRLPRSRRSTSRTDAACLRWPSWGRRTQAGGHPRRRNACGLVQNTEYMPFGRVHPGTTSRVRFRRTPGGAGRSGKHCWHDRHQTRRAARSSPIWDCNDYEPPCLPEQVRHVHSQRSLAEDALNFAAQHHVERWHLGMAACWHHQAPARPPATRLAKLVSRVTTWKR